MSPIDGILALFGLYMLYAPLIAVIVSLVQIARTPKPRSRAVVIEIWLRNYMFWVIGVLFVLNFVYHTVFAGFTAALIGWANSPFQIEVGLASLGIGLAGLLAARHRVFLLRLAAWLTTAPFLWGAAVNHIVDIVQSQNFSPGNAGFVLWMDLLLPALGLVLLILARRHPVAVAVADAGTDGTVPVSGEVRRSSR